jgi:hypothetical protein
LKSGAYLSSLWHDSLPLQGRCYWASQPSAFGIVEDRTRCADEGERGILGTLAVSLWPAGIQVGVPSAYSRCLADAQLFRLSGYELHRDIVAAIRAEVSNLVFPVLLGELAIMLWLIIMGAKETLPWRPPPDPAGIFNFPAAGRVS